MAHLIFDEDEQQQLRDSARERAAAGEGLLAYALQSIDRIPGLNRAPAGLGQVQQLADESAPPAPPSTDTWSTHDGQ
ncbi:hypothetical protein [Streptomyces sp. NPDC056527]|uniref:hypothetical protein n=1 Tax=Streptomyces sp. NPDC056527 TaxID=3345853 RepID=UPI003683FBB0